MATLNIPTVELVSTLRAAPENGPTNSQDYNDSWTESLADLASLSGFINDILLPMLNGLSNTIQPVTTVAPAGIEGRYIFSDTSDLTQLFFDALSSQPLTVADSFRILQGIVNSTEAAIANLNVEVTALQTQLSASNQNDIAQALQNFAASLSSLTSQTVSNTQAIAAVLVQFETDGTLNPVQNKLNLKSGTGISLDNLASSGDVVINSTLVIPSFEHNGTPNTDQTLLNLKAGTGITLADDGSGGITVSIAGGGSGVNIETNGTPNSNQALLNLIAGSNITLGASGGNVTITGSSISDGLIHGDPIWVNDSGYLSLRDDFIQGSGGGVSSGNPIIGQMNWTQGGTPGDVSYGNGQDIFHIGEWTWTNSAVADDGTGAGQAGITFSFVNSGGTPIDIAWPLLSYAGWKMSYVFRFHRAQDTGLPSGGNSVNFNQKAFYCGIGMNIVRHVGSAGCWSRPPIFIGVRYDTDTTSPAISDSTFVLEAVQNAVPNGSAITRNNTQGTTVNTGVTPVDNTYYRLDISCITVGTIHMSFNGSSPSAFTVAPMTVNAGDPGSDGVAAHQNIAVVNLGSVGPNQVNSLFATGNPITIAGLTAGNAALNGTWKTNFTGLGTTATGATFAAPGTGTIGNNGPGGWSITGYPSTSPIILFGNDTQASPAKDLRFCIDFFSFVANSGLSGASVDGTVARYF